MKNNKLIIVILSLIVLVLLATNDKVARFYEQLRTGGSSSTSSSKPIKATCDEQGTLIKAKQCTYLIQSDLGHGSGFSTDQGYLITNKHVIEGASKLFTWINGGKQSLSVWGYSDDADLAVLKVDANIPICDWADSQQISLAETLFAIGWPVSPNGESSITKGIYSRLLKAKEGPEFIQTDAAINQGNSGGPLIDSCGVVGINTAKISWSDPNTPTQGFGFAIAGNYAKLVVDSLIANGKTYSLPIGQMPPKKYTPDYSYNYNQPPVYTPPTPKPIPSDNGTMAGGLSNDFDQNITTNYGTPNLSSVTALGDGNVRLTWDSVGSALYQYDIFYGNSSGNYNFSTSAGSTTTHDVGGLTKGTTYYFTVQAEFNNCTKDKYGSTYCFSPKSREVSVVVK